MKTLIILFTCIAATFAASSNATFQESFENCITISNSETKILLDQLFKKCVNNPEATDDAIRTKKCEVDTNKIVNAQIIKVDACINDIQGIHFSQNFVTNINKTFSFQIRLSIRQIVNECMRKPVNDATECFESATNRDLQRAYNLLYIAEIIYVEQFEREISICVRKQHFDAERTLNCLIPHCEQIGENVCKLTTQALVKAIITEGGQCVKNISSPLKINPALVSYIESQIQKSMIIFVTKAFDECFAKNVTSSANNCLRGGIGRGIAQVNKEIADFEIKYIGIATKI